ncbi:MGA_1079 family surface serine endopeptidase [Mycoplasmopsis columbina]|uniref:MGA_1079 family surface serine endopeptidase n=1 Tax=Mycoplasmopsis columbina TaxID=114881 RepID=UPI0004A76F28|nr:lipoprotein 17-related variable surface protein [Mycoplasmopsis columbina]VEU76761.1 Uncharacterised protein [Mycoplasmopsis columbina]
MKKSKKITIISLASLLAIGTAAGVAGGLAGNSKKNTTDSDQKITDTLNNLNVSFDYLNKEKTFVENIVLEKIIKEVEQNNLNNVTVIDLTILKRNEEEGNVEIQYRLSAKNNDKKDILGQFKTVIINGFKKGTQEEYINGQKNKLLALQLNSSYENKENVFANDALLDNVNISLNNDSVNNEFPNLTINKVNLTSNKEEGKIEVIVNLKYTDSILNRDVSVEKSLIIEGFKTKQENNPQPSNQSEAKNKEIARLNQLAASEEVKNNRILPSLIESNNLSNYVTLKIEDTINNAEIVDLNIANKNDRNGTLTLSYRLKSVVESENVYSESKQINISGFTTELTRLNALEIASVNYENKENTLPSEINVNNLTFTFANSDAMTKVIEVSKSNISNEDGTLTVSFKYQSTRLNLTDVISQTKTINLDGFNSYRKMREKEISRLNSLVESNAFSQNFNVGNIVKNQTLPSEVNDDQIQIIQPDESHLAKIIITEIKNKNNQDGTLLLAYKLQSLKDQTIFNNIQSSLIAQTTINDFLTYEQAKSAELNRLNSTSWELNYPNKEETTASQAQENEFTLMNSTSNEILTKVRIVSADSVNGEVSLEYAIKSTNPRFASETIESSTKTTTIIGFKSDEEAKLLRYVNENYNPDLKTELASNPNIRLFATSINADNFKYYFNEPALENVNIQLTDFILDKDNPLKLKVNYQASRDGVVVNTFKNFDFTNSFIDLIDKIQYTKIEQLFDIDFYALYQYSLEQIKANEKLQNLIFKPKFNKVQRFFNYKLDFDTLTTQNSTETRQYIDFFNERNDYEYVVPHLSANVNFLLQDNVVKTLSLSQSNGRAYVDAQNYTYTEAYKTTNYYQQPLTTSLHQLIKEEAQKIKSEEGIPDQDVNKLINFFEQFRNNIAPPNRIKAKRRILSRIINKYIKFDNFESIEVVDYNNKLNPNIYEYFADKNVLRFRVQGTNKITNQSETFFFVWRAANWDPESEVNKLISIIKSNDMGKIFANSTVKNSNKTHNNILASQAWSEFENLYTLPSQGEYRIGLIPQSLKRPDDSYASDKDGWADLRFTLYKGNEVVNSNLTTNKLRVNFFKLATKDDYKPRNGEWFTAEDFFGNGYSQPSQAIKDKIAQINGTDFEYNYGQGNMKLVDPYKIIEQKAFDKLNYLFKFTGASSSSTSNNEGFGNFDNADAESGENVTPADPTKIYDGVSESAVNVNELARDYYIYYFNVQVDPRVKRLPDTDYRKRQRLAFSLGFINKNNPNERWLTRTDEANLIRLINLKNDYIDLIAPEAALNSITPQDIVKEETYGIGPKISQITASDFAEQIKQANQNNAPIVDYFTIRDNLTYDDTLFNKNNFKIAEVKLANDQEGTAYIRFKYQEKDRYTQQITKTIQGSTWYKINGFKTNPSEPRKDTSSRNVLYSNLNSYYGLTKVFLNDQTNGSVLRKRYIEMNYKDIQIEKAANNRAMTWLFKKDYFTSQLDREGIRDPKINFHFSANSIVINEQRYERILNLDQGLNFTIDYQELKAKGHIDIYDKTESVFSKNYGPIEIPYHATFTLTSEGIMFNFELRDEGSYQIVDKNINSVLFDKFRQQDEVNKHWNEFLPEKAMYFDKNGARVEIEYENDIANEVFNSKQTNTYNYTKMDYTPENQPIILYNETYEDEDLFKYDPNQMIKWKWHEGYKLSNTFMNLKYNHPKVKEVMARTFAMNRGSATMLGKVNDDPNDGRFYAITNNHVVGMRNVPDPTTSVEVQNTTFTRAGYNIGNNVDNGPGYWGGLYVEKTQIIPVWTGKNQLDNSGNSAQFLDITVFIVDINPIIQNATKAGKIETAQWYKNWFNLPNLKLNSITKDYQWSTLSKNGSYTTGEIFNGWPYGKQGGYIVNRSGKGSVNESFTRKDGYLTPIYFNAGNSGTGVLDADGNYVAAINSGRPLSALVSWYGLRPGVNYFGILEEGENVLDLANKNSLASNIMKFNAYDPTIAVPYWIRDLDN